MEFVQLANLIGDQLRGVRSSTNRKFSRLASGAVRGMKIRRSADGLSYAGKAVRVRYFLLFRTSFELVGTTLSEYIQFCSGCHTCSNFHKMFSYIICA